MAQPKDTADKPADASGDRTPDGVKQPTQLRKAVPYLVVALISAVMFGWYFFMYVPPKMQYFLGLRYRELAVAGGQFKSKVDSLAASLAAAPTSADTVAYLMPIVPDLRPEREAPADSLKFGRGNDAWGIRWADVMAEPADLSRGDFDDLLVAGPQGQVLWQRESTTPRIGSLPELLDSPQTDGWSLFSVQWNFSSTPLKLDAGKRTMAKTATSRLVTVAGSTIQLIVQPVHLAKPVRIDDEPNAVETLYLAGTVAQSSVQYQALHVPGEWIAIGLLPFVFVFLALPLIKLATLTPKERYGFVDIVALVVAAGVAIAIGCALPFLAGPPASAADGNLKQFADRIEADLKQEVVRFAALASLIDERREVIRDKLEPCTTAIKYIGGRSVGRESGQVCHFWRALEAANPNEAPRLYVPALDVIVWVGDDRWQTEKWTTQDQVTGPIVHDFQHFRDIVEGRTWTVEGSPMPFTIEPLRSPTTSQMAFMFAVNANSSRDANGHPEEPMLALNVRPQSLVDPLVPPGYGFAILAADGRVLFHSQSALSLEENFFREVGDRQGVAEAIDGGRSAEWTGDYHGRPHRLHARSLEAFERCPWRIVTFKELEPSLAFTAARQTGAAALFGFNLIVLGVLAGGWALVQRARGKELGDVVRSWCLCPREPERVKASVAGLGALSAIAIVLSGLTYEIDPGALTAWYVLFLTLPLAAVAVVIRTALASSDAKAPKTFGRFSGNVWLSAETFLFMMLVAGFPAVGVTQIVHRLDESQRTIQWLRESDRQIAALDLRNPRGASTPKPHSYFELFRATKLETGKPGPGEPDASDGGAVADLLVRLRGLLSGTIITPVDTEHRWPVRRYWLKPSRLGANYDGSSLRQLPVLASLGGLAILASVFGAIAWSRGRLATFQPIARTSLKDAVSRAHLDQHNFNAAVLLIGPPRAEKDQLIQNTLRDVVGKQPYLRIKLLDAELTPAFIDEQVTKVRDERKKGTPKPSDIVWVHLSNLEAQLAQPSTRAQVLRLLEKLLDVHPGERRVALLATSTIDPIFHFTEVFSEERKQIYANEIPEIELNRSSLILSRFQRCYSAIDGDNPWKDWLDYQPTRWRQTLTAETSSHKLLADIASELESIWQGQAAVPMDELRRAIRARSEACYQLLWTSCTRTEKLALIQLAQEGVVNPKCREVVDELMAKGLITPGPLPALFNVTFRDFLQRIERSDVVHEWERMDGAGVWAISGHLAASVLTVGGVFFLLTQGLAMQSVVPLLSGTGLLGAPIIKNLMARVSSGGSASVKANA